ncbi:MAG: hypothetical protein F6K28_45120, partial [Microcoleus sp. SIO2G3]|nr:hypothetical protein [Microcoleus sp. SIO2G3]
MLPADSSSTVETRFLSSMIRSPRSKLSIAKIFAKITAEHNFGQAVLEVGRCGIAFHGVCWFVQRSQLQLSRLQQRFLRCCR